MTYNKLWQFFSFFSSKPKSRWTRELQKCAFVLVKSSLRMICKKGMLQKKKKRKTRWNKRWVTKATSTNLVNAPGHRYPTCFRKPQLRNTMTMQRILSRIFHLYLPLVHHTTRLSILCMLSVYTYTIYIDKDTYIHTYTYKCSPLLTEMEASGNCCSGKTAEYSISVEHHERIYEWVKDLD